MAYRSPAGRQDPRTPVRTSRKPEKLPEPRNRHGKSLATWTRSNHRRRLQPARVRPVSVANEPEGRHPGGTAPSKPNPSRRALEVVGLDTRSEPKPNTPHADRFLLGEIAIINSISQPARSQTGEISAHDSCEKTDTKRHADHHALSVFPLPGKKERCLVALFCAKNDTIFS